MARRSDLSIRLTEARLLRGLNLVDAAEAIGVNRNTVANWERGHPVPGKPMLAAIAVAYGIERDDLLPLWKRANRTRARRRTNGDVAA